jgi:polyphosphate:AMP phosphotransferase
MLLRLQICHYDPSWESIGPVPWAKVGRYRRLAGNRGRMMFETAELGRSVSKKVFSAEEQPLQVRLLAAQRAIKAANIPVLILISGVEGAGKGQVVNVLNKWLDARDVNTHAFWDISDEESERPRFWRFWRVLPPRGTVGILFGSWYTHPIVDHAFERIDTIRYEHQLHRITEFEQLLIDDGALIIKFWCHIGKEEQQERLAKEVGSRIASPQLIEFARMYERFVAVSERAIRITDFGHAPWHIIESTDQRYQHLAVGRILLNTLEARLAGQARDDGCPPLPVAAVPDSIVKAPPPEVPGDFPTVLDSVDLNVSMDDRDYATELVLLQEQLRRLTWQAKAQKRNTVLVFEGWDAAGKGGAIRRLIEGIDARLCRVISVSAPTDEEKAQHYLWRFWRHVPRAGFVTIYDRSWYGRVLVERVEGFARRQDWARAYQEINDFEEQLCEHGVIVHKFWLHISPEEQLTRFKQREIVEWKQHKITADDWRNRANRDAYEQAVHDMVSRTSTHNSPWSLIAANDKKVARIAILRAVCERLETALQQP